MISCLIGVADPAGLEAGDPFFLCRWWTGTTLSPRPEGWTAMAIF